MFLFKRAFAFVVVCMFFFVSVFCVLGGGVCVRMCVLVVEVIL